MPTPYEQISEAYASKDMQKTDANLAQDSLQLGGIDAEEYATKDYARRLVNNKSEADRLYAKQVADGAEANSNAYTDAEIRKLKGEVAEDYATIEDRDALKRRVKSLEDRADADEGAISNNAIAITRNSNAIDGISTEIQIIENNLSNIDAKHVKLENQNFHSNNVHDGMTELFQSVSNGKRQVAAAITDKGVTTADDASFNTMAHNIGEISTLAEDTADANAAAADITKDKIAYVRGQKVIGTNEGGGGGGIDTSDATAYSSDIMLGKTAYARGIKLTGIAEVVSPEMPEIRDTGDATATAADIASGKTAYARGVKITGVAAFSEGVDTDDATAYASDIVSGKTAYARGSKVIGTAELGTDTTDANATALDILSGKTAYVNGVKVTGIAAFSGGVDTDDATATAADIVSGKTAYAQGSKIFGTAVLGTDTTDADATADDIKIGKTAYVNGNKITGTSRVVDPTTPEVLDTSDADATADDIRYGKVAYVQGQRVVGTYTGSTGRDLSYGQTGGQVSVIEEVTPIYQNIMGEYKYLEINPLGLTPSPRVINSIDQHGTPLSDHQAGEGTMASNMFAVTRDGYWYVVVREVNSKKVFTMCRRYYSVLTDVIMGAYNDYKFEDMGIPENAEIKGMTFGAYGYAGYESCCLLAVIWTTSNQRKLSLICCNTYGAGKMLCNDGACVPYYEMDCSNGHTTSDNYIPLFVAMARNNPYVAAVYTKADGFGGELEVFKVYSYTGAYTSDRRSLGWSDDPISLTFACNDRIIVARCSSRYNYDIGFGSTNIAILDTEDYSILNVVRDNTNGISAYFYNSVFSPDGAYAIHKTDGYWNDYTTSYKLARVSITDSGITFIDQGNSNIGIALFSNPNVWFSSDNTMLFVYSNGHIRKYQTDLTGNNPFTFIESISVGYSYKILDNLAGTFFAGMYKSGNNAKFWELEQEKDGTAIVGIMWRGNSYYQFTPGTMSAQPSDVRLGKTFIGLRGVLETGNATISSGGE